MYATLSYDVSVGDKSIEELRLAIFEVLKERETLDVLADTLICRVTNTSDYLEVVRDLTQVGKTFQDQFQFVITLHSAKAPLRSNASFSKDKAKQIIE